MESSNFACPRCKADVTERFYGPCSSCRSELHATQRNASREVEAQAYEPKMNVVPNQIATKE
jgi:Fe-S cluster biogenesis protein NfuA